MNTYVPSDEVLALYAQAAARLASLERMAAAALAAPGSAQAKRDAMAALDEAAQAIRAFYDSFSFAIDPSRDTLGIGTEADRRQKKFLGEFLTRLAASVSAVERRLDQAGSKAASELESADPSIIDARLQAAPADASPDSRAAVASFLPALQFFRSLASRLPAEASKARVAKSSALDKELLSIKMRSFMDQSAPLSPRNPELLFKVKTKFERLEQEGAPRSVLAEQPDGTVCLLKADGGLELRYGENGVSIELVFRLASGGKYEGVVSGYVESAGERAEFCLVDPQAKEASKVVAADPATAYAAFLARFDLRRLYESAAASFSKLEDEAKRKPVQAAEKLSKALDDIL